MNIGASHIPTKFSATLGRPVPDVDNAETVLILQYVEVEEQYCFLALRANGTFFIDSIHNFTCEGGSDLWPSHSSLGG